MLGAGAAACAICCAPPLIGLLGLVGFAATLATVAFAGIAFGLAVATATAWALWRRRRGAACATEGATEGTTVVDVDVSAPWRGAS